MFSFFIIVPLALVVLLNLLPIKRMCRVAFGSALLFAALQTYVVVARPIMLWTAPDVAANFLSLQFTLDNFTFLLLLSIGIVTFASLLVAKGVYKEGRQLFNFINLVLIATVGLNATVMASDLFTLYVFIELTAVALFTLIAIEKGSFALEGAFKYLIMSAIASAMMLLSIGLILMIAGGTSFVVVKGALLAGSSSFYVKLAIGLYLMGLFIKSGIVPFHGWLPDAYSAASNPTSVFLAGIVTKTSGVYVLMRLVVSVFGASQDIQQVLMFVGAGSILVGAFAAMWQSNFKRMLSYSSISQVGYIILALGCGTPLAIAGAAFHIFNHAIFKSLLFVNASAIEDATGTQDMAAMRGLSAKMPATSASSLVGFLSTAGIPPLAGFWSKLIIIMALWASGNHTYTVIALVGSVMTLGYFLLMQRKVFFCKPEAGGGKEASLWFVVPEVMLALITIGVGVMYPVVLDKLILNIGNFLR